MRQTNERPSHRGRAGRAGGHRVASRPPVPAHVRAGSARRGHRLSARRPSRSAGNAGHGRASDPHGTPHPARRRRWCAPHGGACARGNRRRRSGRHQHRDGFGRAPHPRRQRPSFSRGAAFGWNRGTWWPGPRTAADGERARGRRRFRLHCVSVQHPRARRLDQLCAPAHRRANGAVARHEGEFRQGTCRRADVRVHARSGDPSRQGIDPGRLHVEYRGARRDRGARHGTPLAR